MALNAIIAEGGSGSDGSCSPLRICHKSINIFAP